ncbi:hypothetical protein QBC36DRAFT_338396 [Triangularia setosa]|uniref:Uncharacterized protein n=1 Tax=Triangularia setosa TaxID=2587417 RepID=A0AAN6VYR9_9PEZI|nr:hypothetical protein QBC36DRAFT_338396 [Podospora setosa]
MVEGPQRRIDIIHHLSAILCLPSVQLISPKMDKLKSFFRHKETALSPPPSLSQEIVLLPTSEKWQGNLPCVHGPNDGCNNHNPGRNTIPFDPSLLPNSTKTKPSGNKPPADPFPPTYVFHQIWSTLPKSFDPSLGYLTTLPAIHKSLLLSISFYHLYELFEKRRNGTFNPANDLGIFACAATTGSNPALSWVITPLITARATLNLEFALAFLLETDLGGWTEETTHGRAIVKNGLIGSGYRDFKPCLHTHLKFTSIKGEGKNHMRYSAVNFITTDSDGVEKKHEWKSEEQVENDIEGLFCGKCYTETVMRIRMIREKTLVSVQVYKDLGWGLHPGDGKWLSLVRSDVRVTRDKSDFLRIRKAFEVVTGNDQDK